MPELLDSLSVFLGRTVTIFTTSGGLSGSGFTGVLISVDDRIVRLLVHKGAPPACALGSACTGPIGNGYNYPICNPLGSECVIPIRAIACFTHNAI